MYKIAYSSSVAKDLKSIGIPKRSLILDEIETQLTREPNRGTRNRKVLIGLVAPWKHVPPVWELRIGEYRVFYDIDEKAKTVIIRAIRHKPPHKTTEEIV